MLKAQNKLNLSDCYETSKTCSHVIQHAPVLTVAAQKHQSGYLIDRPHIISN